MGVGNIIENNIGNGCEFVWKRVPELPEWSMNLTRYNKSFVGFVSLVGAYALIKSSIYVGRKSIQLARPAPKIPSAIQMQQKYGDHSWALIVDCKGNQQYCILLAQRGFSLILCGEEDDIKIAEDRITRESGQSEYKIQTVIVDWQQQAKNIPFYEQLDQRLKDFDISIMVMPTITKEKTISTSLQRPVAFEHIYLMARYFGPRLKWRSYSSAIIIPSTEKVDMIDEQGNGITRAIQSGVDAFGRTLGFQLKNIIQVIIARGSPENALANLGKVRISH